MAHGLGMRDRLHDHVALDEIELYAEVLIAVADADRPLSPAEIDRVLGLGQEPDPGPELRDTPEPLAHSPAPGTDTTAPGATDTPEAGPSEACQPAAAPRPRRPAAGERPANTAGPGHGSAPFIYGTTGSGPGSDSRIIAPVPPARDGRAPTPVLPLLHDSLPGGSRTAHPLCGPFVPWRAWQL
ncbi:hypothetical protein NE857_32570 [Nocardiopsis exhalans]|uniref:Uncharacterized protein n=1 Tax=Nocardiopsis exhalans TaxID=163604 RepID=A0ABY5D6A7_9ACTN|nr:hypothetical protein [Nocardiopsis exhalans]USY19906.1 hypothetical protein NE857_32570 [Nocardiopsis exhalans]